MPCKSPVKSWIFWEIIHKTIESSNWTFKKQFCLKKLSLFFHNKRSISDSLMNDFCTDSNSMLGIDQGHADCAGVGGVHAL